jgi:hypothetical protein
MDWASIPRAFFQKGRTQEDSQRRDVSRRERLRGQREPEGEGNGQCRYCNISFSTLQNNSRNCVLTPHFADTETKSQRERLTRLRLQLTAWIQTQSCVTPKPTASLPRNDAGGRLRPGKGVEEKVLGPQGRAVASGKTLWALAHPLCLSLHTWQLGGEMPAWLGGAGGVLTSRIEPAGRGRRQASASGTWASHKQPGRRAYSSRPPCNAASRAGRQGTEGSDCQSFCLRPLLNCPEAEALRGRVC